MELIHNAVESRDHGLVATEGLLVDALRHRLLEQARHWGDYQQDVILGAKRLSGSDLKGKAKSYSGSYARSRAAVIDAWQQAGGVVAVVGPHRSRVLAVALP